MNRVDHWAEALRLLSEEAKGWDPSRRVLLDADELQRLRDLAKIHAGLACIPDSISGALDARAKLAERRQR